MKRLSPPSCTTPLLSAVGSGISRAQRFTRRRPFLWMRVLAICVKLKSFSLTPPRLSLSLSLSIYLFRPLHVSISATSFFSPAHSKPRTHPLPQPHRRAASLRALDSARTTARSAPRSCPRRSPMPGTMSISLVQCISRVPIGVSWSIARVDCSAMSGIYRHRASIC